MTTLKSYKGISPDIGENVYIDTSAILVGQVAIGEDSSIWPFVSARGDVNSISIGRRSNIQDASVLHVTHKSEKNPEGFPLIIGDDVTIGHKVMLHGCVIQDRVLVGMSAIVLDGVTIEHDVMIGAGSLVPPNKVLKSGYLYVGSPVKQVRLLTNDERAFLKKSASNYVETKNNYLLEMKPVI
ncbi:gamma carbonic anhydrase family protein [Vibrio sp. MA40-2]|uniref:gamma carbonic anhydrase family protein n=1 Tax=Vibrio sp. MA40-2 TaxID=3391828 RepID=UPI0039A56C6A